MPQHLADFGQRRAMPQHLGRQGVAKLMRPGGGGLDARTRESVSHERSNRLRAHKAANGGFDSQEHTTAGGVRSSVTQVCGDRLAGIYRYRQRGPQTAYLQRIGISESSSDC